RVSGGSRARAVPGPRLFREQLRARGPPRRAGNMAGGGAGRRPGLTGARAAPGAAAAGGGATRAAPAWAQPIGRRGCRSLSPSQINEVLRAGELSHKILGLHGKNASSVLKFESNQLASNTPIEDRRSAATCLQSRGMMFGVFDGHAGSACAQAVSERLLHYIAVSLLSRQTLEEMELAVESMKPILPVLQLHKHPNDVEYREITSQYFESLRESELMRNIALQVAFSGATACVAHIDGVHLHVANAGDCRAILGVCEEDGTWSTLPLTRDHNAYDESEIKRLKREHPKSEEKTLLVNDRLLGILMPSRAFGDVQLKWSKELQQKPEVTYHKLRGKDKFLVIASDGLWEMLSNEMVVKLVAGHLAEFNMQKPQLAFEKPINLGYMHNLLLQRKSRGTGSLDQNINLRS
uniref:Pyruvate dehyrogenase phosphatase catalytic subunit 2 n=1 Tax=Nothoprocta perdicaria TaxID=30464 RepID=A0A8C6Z1P6_NOTPE